MKTRAKTIVWALGILVGAIIVLSVSAYLILAIFETDFHIQDKIGVIPIKGPIVRSESIISQLVNFRKYFPDRKQRRFYGGNRAQWRRQNNTA